MMALVINHNMSSINAQRNLANTGRSLKSSFEKVSSGLRINKAADDAAGMGVAENLEAASRSAKVAMRNTNDGISVVQTAEGATSEVGNIVKRMRELAVQSSSETLATAERSYVQDEFAQLSAEVDRISQVTEFNGLKLTDGSDSSISVQVGVNNTSSDRISITMGDLRSTALGVDTTTMSLNSSASARSAIALLDTALDSINSIRSDYGAVQNRLSDSLVNMEVYDENLNAAESQIRDVDFASETANMAKHQIMQQAGMSVLAQSGQAQQGILSLI
jgi:flagellin